MLIGKKRQTSATYRSTLTVSLRNYISQTQISDILSEPAERTMFGALSVTYPVH